MQFDQLDEVAKVSVALVFAIGALGAAILLVAMLTSSPP